MSFKAIETQEQLDAIIGERLAREKEKYSNYVSPEDVQKLKDTYAGYMNAEETQKLKDEYEKKISKLAEDSATTSAKLKEQETKLKAYERSSVKIKVAHEVGLPFEMSDRLSGETEEDIRKDAEMLKGLIGSNHKPEPLASREQGSSKEDSLRNMLRNLKGE